MSRPEQQRRLVTELPGPRSRELLARRAAAVPAGVGTVMPIFAAAAGGGVVVDVDGNSLIDFGSGIGVLNVGSSDARVVSAAREQLGRFTHTCFQVTPYEPYLELAETLNALTPGRHEKRTFLVNSGAEAVENAVKIARRSTGRRGVVTFDHAFHGRTLLGMSLTAKVQPYKDGFGPFATDVHRLPYSYPYRCAGGASPTCGSWCADMAIQQMDKIGPDQLACLIVEPVQGEGGVIVPGEGFLPALEAYCRRHGIVFIVDEIQTGFGRTGYWFASEHDGIVPDIVTTAKGMGGGLPIGGVTGRAELMDAVHPGGLGTTFGGNPVSCAAALAAVRAIEEDALLARARTIGAALLGRFTDLQLSHPRLGDVRGRGAMVALEFVRDADTREPDPAAATQVLQQCHSEGLVLLKAGSYDNVVRILPPLTMPDSLLAEGITLVEKAIGEL